MGTSHITVTVSEDLERWVRGLTDFGLDSAALDEWYQANDAFFERTQRFVHILSGDLKRSGTMDVEIEGKTLVGATTYGGTQGTEGPVDYAIYELAAGGSHDFIGRALASSTDLFRDGVRAAIVAQMAKNLGVHR